jgi:hypothetical protein
MDFVLRKTAQQYALQGTQPFAGFGSRTTPSSSNPGTPAPVDIPPRLLDIQDLLESLNIIEQILIRGQ